MIKGSDVQLNMTLIRLVHLAALVVLLGHPVKLLTTIIKVVGLLHQYLHRLAPLQNVVHNLYLQLKHLEDGRKFHS